MHPNSFSTAYGSLDLKICKQKCLQGCGCDRILTHMKALRQLAAKKIRNAKFEALQVQRFIDGQTVDITYYTHDAKIAHREVTCTPAHIDLIEVLSKNRSPVIARDIKLVFTEAVRDALIDLVQLGLVKTEVFDENMYFYSLWKPGNKMIIEWTTTVR